MMAVLTGQRTGTYADHFMAVHVPAAFQRDGVGRADRQHTGLISPSGSARRSARN